MYYFYFFCFKVKEIGLNLIYVKNLPTDYLYPGSTSLKAKDWTAQYQARLAAQFQAQLDLLTKNVQSIKDAKD